MNKYYNLFLDDFRYPETAFQYMKDPRYLKLQWKIVRNYDEFVCTVDSYGIPEIVSYDHDLGEEHYDMDAMKSSDDYNKLYESFKEKTGLECAKYLIEKLNGKEHPEYIIHSMNPVGAENIYNIIKDYEYRLKNK